MIFIISTTQVTVKMILLLQKAMKYSFLTCTSQSQLSANGFAIMYQIPGALKVVPLKRKILQF